MVSPLSSCLTDTQTDSLRSQGDEGEADVQNTSCQGEKAQTGTRRTRQRDRRTATEEEEGKGVRRRRRIHRESGGKEERGSDDRRQRWRRVERGKAHVSTGLDSCMHSHPTHPDPQRKGHIEFAVSLSLSLCFRERDSRWRQRQAAAPAFFKVDTAGLRMNAAAKVKTRMRDETERPLSSLNSILAIDP